MVSLLPPLYELDCDGFGFGGLGLVVCLVDSPGFFFFPFFFLCFSRHHHVTAQHQHHETII